MSSDPNSFLLTAGIALGAGFAVGFVLVLVARYIAAWRQRRDDSFRPLSRGADGGLDPVAPSAEDAFVPRGKSRVNGSAPVCALPCWICGQPKNIGTHNHR